MFFMQLILSDFTKLYNNLNFHTFYSNYKILKNQIFYQFSFCDTQNTFKLLQITSTEKTFLQKNVKYFQFLIYSQLKIYRIC
jgi:hypothetical protein